MDEVGRPDSDRRDSVRGMLSGNVVIEVNSIAVRRSVGQFILVSIITRLVVDDSLSQSREVGWARVNANPVEMTTKSCFESSNSMAFRKIDLPLIASFASEFVHISVRKLEPESVHPSSSSTEDSGDVDT